MPQTTKLEEKISKYLGTDLGLVHNGFQARAKISCDLPARWPRSPLLMNEAEVDIFLSQFSIPVLLPTRCKAECNWFPGQRRRARTPDLGFLSVREKKSWKMSSFLLFFHCIFIFHEYYVQLKRSQISNISGIPSAFAALPSSQGGKALKCLNTPKNFGACGGQRFYSTYSI